MDPSPSDGASPPRGRLARSARLAALPAAYAGRSAVGLGKRGMAAIPKPRMLVVLGHILEDASPEERAAFILKAPPPARLLYKLVARRKYERAVAALRAGTPQQRRG